MKKLVICEPQCKDASHETCNSAYIYAICNAYQNVNVRLFAHKSQIENLKEFWKNRNVNIKNLDFEYIDFSNVYCADTANKEMKCIVDKIDQYLCNEKQKNVFFTSVNPLILSYLKNTDLYCCCILHGGLEEFNNECKKNHNYRSSKISIISLMKDVYHFCLSLKTLPNDIKIKKCKKKYSYKNVLFNLDESKFSFIVLSEHILKNLRNKFQLTNNYCYVPHFYLKANNVIHKNNSYPKFAVLGYGADNSLFSDLAAKLKDVDGKYELRNIGMRHYDNYSNNPNFIQLDKGFLSREEMEKQIENIDFFLNFYTPDTYKFTCSGSIIEAFVYERPVIYIKNDCYNSYNQPYQFGIECDNIDEMAEKIKNIIFDWEKFKKVKYKDLLANLQMKKQEISIENNLECLKSAMAIFNE